MINCIAFKWPKWPIVVAIGGGYSKLTYFTELLLAHNGCPEKAFAKCRNLAMYVAKVK